MVRLIDCAVRELNKERHLTAELMKEAPKRPQCAHYGFFPQSGHLCKPRPLASSCLSVCHGHPFSGTLWRENCSRPEMARSPEHHVDPWRLEIRVDVTGSGLLSPLELWHGAVAGQSCAGIVWRGFRRSVSDGKA